MNKIKKKEIKAGGKEPLTAVEENAIVNKIRKNHFLDILKLLARHGYYVYSKNKEGEPTFCPSEKCMIKLMSNILDIHKKDGYLNEMYVDDNIREMTQKGFLAFQDTAVRCFPNIIFPSVWFGGYPKKYWADIQMITIAFLLNASLSDNDENGFLSQIKGFFENRFYKDREVLLDWHMNIRGLPKTQAFTLVAEELGKSASYVRDHYNEKH